MKETITAKINEIVEAICKKDPRSISKDEYDILSAELRRIVYDDEMKEKNKKLAETMGVMLGSSCCASY